MNKHVHQAKKMFNYFLENEDSRFKHTRYFGENSCKSLTGISTPTAPNRIVSSCD